MSEIHESIAQKVAAWKAIFKDNIQTFTGKTDPRAAADMSYVEIMQLTQDTDYTMAHLAQPTAKAMLHVGTFDSAEKNALNTKQRAYLVRELMPYLETEIPFARQIKTGPIIGHPPTLAGRRLGVICHNFGEINMFEIFYETSNDIAQKLPDTLILNPPYLTTIKAVEDLEAIPALKTKIDQLGL